MAGSFSFDLDSRIRKPATFCSQCVPKVTTGTNFVLDALGFVLQILQARDGQIEALLGFGGVGTPGFQVRICEDEV
jgi:hypothetical protein